MATLLIVDDEKLIRDLLREALSQYGHEVLAAESGLEALKLFQDSKPDFTFLDLGMPGMNGIEVLKQMRALDPNSAVLILTASDSKVIENQARQLGAKEFVNKDVTLDALIATVDRAMEGRLKVAHSNADGVSEYHVKRSSTSRSMLEILNRIPLFHGVAHSILLDLASFSVLQNYRTGDYICRPDDQMNALFFLLDGQVQLVMTDFEGKETGIKILEPGQWFGELALLDGQYRDAVIIALQPSQALLLTRSAFTDLLKRHPGLAIELLAISQRRLFHVLNLVKRVQCGTPSYRMAKVLITLADEHGEAHDLGTQIRFHLSHQNLADLTGLTRETTSKTISAFRDSAALVLGENGHWIVADRERLEKEAGVRQTQTAQILR